jgi:uncharacterized protein
MILNRFLNYPSYLLVLLPMLWGCSSLALSPLPVPVKSNSTPPVAKLEQNLPITAKIVVQKKVISLEVARTKQEHMIGLMSRRSMPIDQGMLFDFGQLQPAQFWMKNTLIPLDMLFLQKGIIKNIQANVPPCKADPCPSYGPKPDVLIDQVIELNAGRAATLGLKVGDKLLVQKVLIVEPKRP